MQSCSRSRYTHTSGRFKIKLSLITFRLFSLARVQSANVETVRFGSGSNDYSRFKHLNFLHFTTADTSLIQWFHAFPRMIIFYEEAARSPLFVKHPLHMHSGQVQQVSLNNITIHRMTAGDKLSHKIPTSFMFAAASPTFCSLKVLFFARHLCHPTSRVK